MSREMKEMPQTDHVDFEDKFGDMDTPLGTISWHMEFLNENDDTHYHFWFPRDTQYSVDQYKFAAQYMAYNIGKPTSFSWDWMPDERKRPRGSEE